MAEKEKIHLKCMMAFLAAFCFFALVWVGIAERTIALSLASSLFFLLFIGIGLRLRKKTKE